MRAAGGRAGCARESLFHLLPGNTQLNSTCRAEYRGRRSILHMNFIENIWNHPKTSAAGLLIAIATVTGVLSQQGITLGTAGTGTVVSLVGALATALLGLLAKDPDNAASQQSAGASSRQSKLGVWMLAALLTGGSLTATGCSASTVNKVVSEIDAYLPTVVSLLNEALTIYSAVNTSSTNSNSVSPALARVESDLTNLEKPLADYLSATSSASRTTAWSNIEALVDTVVNDADTLLSVAKVSDPTSKQTGTLVIATLNAAVHTIDAFVTSAQNKTEIQAKLAKRSMKIASVERMWSDADRRQIAAATGTSYPSLLRAAGQMGF
jgi:hypothetical protein